MTGNEWGTPAPERGGGLKWWGWLLVAAAGLVGAFPVALWVWLYFLEITPGVTRDDANRHVARVVNAALDRDFAELCRLEWQARHCESALAAGARDSAPTERPTFVLRDEHDGAAWLFVVRGRDGRGAPYESELVVRRDGGRGAVAVNAVFWTGARVGPGEFP